MSLYNMIFGVNQRADLLLAVVGLRKHDVERFRDVHATADGACLVIHTRTGGGNREDFPNEALRTRPEWRSSVDDDGDSTYCNDALEVPEQWRGDVAALDDLLAHGMRAEFARHLALTLRREPTDKDKAVAAHDQEAATLRNTRHLMANGHTFVPLDDRAMECALRLAEENGGELRSCWGIFPMALTIKQDRDGVRAEIGYDYSWKHDAAWWARAKEKWSAKFPKAIAATQESIDRQAEAARR